MKRDDLEDVAGLQRACFPAPFPEELLWQVEHLQRHLEVFPDGQFVAESPDGRIVASASALLISEDIWQAHRDWETTTGGFAFAGHDPGGTTLYGADISVHPGFRRHGIGRRLYRARFDIVRRRGLTRYGTACRIPGFAAWSKRTGGDQEAYVEAVVQGKVKDRTLTPLLRYGLQPRGIIRNYIEDEESADSAALLEWTP
jgi:ribosomal protein S18 acetylase RimI-like enzyme